MKRVILLVVVLGLLLTGLPVILAQEDMPEPVKCSIPFGAGVNVGPSQGSVFAGTLEIDVDGAGVLQGQLKMEEGDPIPVYGQVTGRAVSLIFELEAGTDNTAGSYIFGTGTTLNPILEDPKCGTALGGTFAGPEEGDIGDWAGHCVRLVDFTSDTGFTTICALQDPSAPIRG